LSSHRILTTATHLGDGVYGKATGKKLAYRVIANCHAKNNAIDDEWLIRDQGAIIRQMGVDPVEYARDLIKREGGPEACVQPFTPAIDQVGPYKGRGNENEWGVRHADILTRIMNADITVIKSEYDRAVQSEVTGGITGYGWDTVERFWMGLRASFPSAKFQIEHQIGREDPYLSPRSAILWGLTGKHEGWGMFGKPTGAEVHIMGASHVEFGPIKPGEIKLRREWTLFDETAVWKQILLQTGDI